MNRDESERVKMLEIEYKTKAMKWAKLDGFKNYLIFEDGSIFNTRWGRFLVQSKLYNGKYLLVKLRGDNNNVVSMYVHKLIEKLFGIKLPEFKNVTHKPLKDFEDLYEIYSSGKVYSKKRNKFIKTIDHNQTNYVHLTKNKKLYVRSLPRLVYSHFGGTFDEKKEMIEHIDKDLTNNDISNLKIANKNDHDKKVVQNN